MSRFLCLFVALIVGCAPSAALAPAETAVESTPVPTTEPFELLPPPTPVVIPTPLPTPVPPPPEVPVDLLLLPTPTPGLVTFAERAQRIVPQPSNWSITADGLYWMRVCESSDNYTQAHGLGLFHGAYQFLPSTWDSAARAAGFPEWAGVLPGSVPPPVQDAVTAFHYSHSYPPSQWPNCYDDAERGMGRPAPCIGRNVIGC